MPSHGPSAQGATMTDESLCPCRYCVSGGLRQGVSRWTSTGETAPFCEGAMQRCRALYGEPNGFTWEPVGAALSVLEGNT